MGRFKKNKKKQFKRDFSNPKKYTMHTRRLNPTTDSEYAKFLKEMQRRGTVVMGVDSCMCADCIARRKTGDIRDPVFDADKIAQMQPPKPSPVSWIMEEEE